MEIKKTMLSRPLSFRDLFTFTRIDKILFSIKVPFVNF